MKGSPLSRLSAAEGASRGRRSASPSGVLPRVRLPRDGSPDEAERHNLLVTHHALIGRFVRSLASCRDEAEEMVQDVAVVVLQHHATPLDPTAFAGWCYWVARNVAAHKRREARRKARCQDAGELDLQSTSVSQLDDPERTAECKQQLAAHVHGLDEEALALLFRRYVLEETSSEIGAQLNLSAASVRMRITRLMATLRD
jgi:RNA polymerase sigma factor (sigma-70 family)